MNVTSTTYRIGLNKVNLKGETFWQWWRSDGEKVSPRFETKQEAATYAERMPMLTKSEWLERPEPQ